MALHKPQQKLLTVWRLLLTAAVIPPAFLCSFLLDPGSLLWFLLSALWVSVYLFLYLYYLPLRYACLCFFLRDGALCVQSGAFSHTLSVLPFCNIQFTTVFATPLDRLFGLCALRVVSPGARILLPGLCRTHAEALASVLAESREENS